MPPGVYCTKILLLKSHEAFGLRQQGFTGFCTHYFCFSSPKVSILILVCDLVLWGVMRTMYDKGCGLWVGGCRGLGGGDGCDRVCVCGGGAV